MKALRRLTTLQGIGFAILCLAAAAVNAAGDHGTPTEEPIWEWSPEQIKKHVNRVRAGRDLSPKSWPNGAKVAVSFSFDIDTEPVWVGFQEVRTPSYMSRGEYGARTGQPRVLKLLEKHKIPATFFIPAMTMELHPEVVPAILKHPEYEIAFHSYVHENPLRLNAADERRIYEKAMKIFEKHVGRKPLGFRSAAWDLTDSTIKIVKEMGFLYDTSMMSDERPYMLNSYGKETGLIELPVEWILDDWPLFQISWPTKHVAIRNAEDVLSIWRDEFDVAHEEGTLFMLTMHPQVIGHRYRMKMLDKLITHMKSKGDVWFATHEQVARHVKKQAGL
jgi:peptidoglycan/xylan/chitin deacetylase (PgdA/CDA1 family)